MKVQITVLDSAGGARIILDSKNTESVNIGNGEVHEFEAEIIEIRELGLVGGDDHEDYTV